MIIGLTGSIASGKSTVAKLLASYNLPIVDADQVARKVIEPGTETLKEIVQAFGSDILAADGSMDSAKVGAIIFHDESQRQVLNRIIHPQFAQKCCVSVMSMSQMVRSMLSWTFHYYLKVNYSILSRRF